MSDKVKQEVKQELLPCPFCGSDSFAFVEGSTFKWHKIECNTCGASCGEVRRKGDDMVELTKEWNTRLDSKPLKFPPEGEINHERRTITI